MHPSGLVPGPLPSCSGPASPNSASMNRSPRALLLCTALGLGVACTSQTPSSQPAVIHPSFDPGNSPPVVPLPNDLATDPATGLLHITPNPDATEADKAFIFYLNTL